MLFTFFPAAASASGEDAVYTQVTELDALTDGQYALVAETASGAKAFGTSIGNKIDGTDVSITADGLSSSSSIPTWTVTVSDGSATFYNGSDYLGYGSSGTNFTKPDEAYGWNITSNSDGTFRFTASGAATRAIAWQDQGGRFGAYSTTNPEGYVFDLLVFKAEGGGEVTPPDPEEPETISIAEALAAADGTENLTVKGVVTLLDGKNVYLQDSTGGICVRMSNNFDDIALGDTVIGTGKRATFNGLPQLENSTYEKSSGLTLTPAVKTIGELTTADICTYVTLRNVEVTEIFDNNGQYSNPNITVKDSSGNTIELYKAVVDKNEDGTWPVAVGSVITITAAVGVFND